MKTKRVRNKIKLYWGKFWYLLWKDDSLKGWIFALVFLFIFVKLIFFPIMNLITGTTLPLAIVESCSMYHQGNLFSNFDNWYDRHDSKYSNLGLSKQTFENFKFKKGTNKGDILLITGIKPEKLKVGDIIAFDAGQANPVIHRIINIEGKNGERIFTTIGDNVGIIQKFEKEIHEDQLVGKIVFKIVPSIGWAKLIGADIWNKIVHRKDFEYIPKGFCEEN